MTRDEERELEGTVLEIVARLNPSFGEFRRALTADVAGTFEGYQEALLVLGRLVEKGAINRYAGVCFCISEHGRAMLRAARSTEASGVAAPS